MNKELLAALAKGAWPMERGAFTMALQAAFGEVSVQTSVKTARPQGRANNRNAEEFFGTRRKMRIVGDTALIDINGVILPRDNYIAWIYDALGGASTIEAIRDDLLEAVEDRKVERIVLNLDSPGGYITEVQELAEEIRRADNEKPVTAYVNGWACSAGYWLASAAREIIAAPTAEVGSIGVLAIYHDFKKAMEMMGIEEITIVSSQSPNKVADPATEEGYQLIQERLDALAEVFIGEVAAGRGVDRNTVVKEFGAGGVFGAAEAMKRGMVDGIGVLDDVLRGTVANRGTSEGNDTTEIIDDAGESEDSAMDKKELQAKHPDLYQAVLDEGKALGKAEGDRALETLKAEQATALETAKAEGAKAESERIAAVIEADPVFAKAVKAADPHGVIQAALTDGSSQVKDVQAGLYAAERKTTVAMAEGIHADAQALDGIQPAPAAVQGDDDAAAVTAIEKAQEMRGK